MVRDPARAVQKLVAGGWVLDGGASHGSGGTANRRLVWPSLGFFFELLWVEDVEAAAAGRLRQDRRADGSASPIGIALRGSLPESQRASFWLYDELGFPIWIHHDNERDPSRPLVLVMELDLSERRSMLGSLDVSQPAALRGIRVHGPSAPDVPPYGGPPIEHVSGSEDRLELIVDGSAGAALSLALDHVG